MKFRKKPVVIEAIQFDRENDGAAISKCLEFVGGKAKYDADCCCLLIQTLEGEMTAMSGDWIIKGVKGEFYPCKPDIFKMTYEEANTKTKDEIFINHIKSHLKKGEKVICKICGKSVGEIINQSTNQEAQ